MHLLTICLIKCINTSLKVWLSSREMISKSLPGSFWNYHQIRRQPFANPTLPIDGLPFSSRVMLSRGGGWRGGFQKGRVWVSQGDGIPPGKGLSGNSCHPNLHQSPTKGLWGGAIQLIAILPVQNPRCTCVGTSGTHSGGDYEGWKPHYQIATVGSEVNITVLKYAKFIDGLKHLYCILFIYC